MEKNAANDYPKNTPQNKHETAKAMHETRTKITVRTKERTRNREITRGPPHAASFVVWGCVMAW